jgi:thioredoxin-disulfide reductase
MVYDLIIVGGGPAGITAGIYAARKKINTLILSKDFTGQTGRAALVENYPGFEEISGLQLIEKFKKHLEKFDIDIKEDEEAIKIEKKEGGFQVNTTKKNRYSAKTIIIASGKNHRPLGVAGEKEFLGRGVSYCVTCDGVLFSGKTVVVIGGGNAGFETALELDKYCPKVYILEFAPKVRADEINQEKAKASEKIEVICNAKAQEIKGKNFVSSLVYQDQLSKKNIELSVEGIFVEIGSMSATSFVGDLVDFNQGGEVKIDHRTGATKTSGFFAAGDVTDIRDKQIITACGEGAKAALSVYEYLQKNNERK